MKNTLSAGEAVSIVPNVVYDSFSAGVCLHRSPRWVAKMCAAGRIRGVKNKNWRIMGEDLIKYLRGEVER